MNFETYGPFEFSRDDVRRSKVDFWHEVEKREEGLSETIGCYVFGLKTDQKLTPWYIGKTIAKKGFKGEVFTPHKLDHYEAVLSAENTEKKFRKGSPFLTLFPLMTETGWFSANRSAASVEISWLEQIMIGMAIIKNREIVNTAFTRFHRDTKVRGLIGEWQGRPSKEAADAERLFFD